MKLFAKRKRKLEHDAVPLNDDKKTEPDPVVIEILKQDPSTWNAKQRRLVKRYEDRCKSRSLPVDLAASETIETSQNSEVRPAVENLGDEGMILESSVAVGAEESVRSTKVEIVDTENDHRQSLSSEFDDGKITAINTASETDPPCANEHPSGSQSVTIVDAAFQEILDQLNSKQRRKLMRQLERGGNLEQVRLEAQSLLDSEQKSKGTPLVEAPLPEPPTKKLRHRRPVVDPSTLTPEERLRRDEQRRMQQAAADARKEATGSIASHKHPLNSERRRANRRKPKWESKGLAARPNEHDLSGYHMRKITKAERV